MDGRAPDLRRYRKKVPHYPAFLLPAPTPALLQF